VYGDAVEQLRFVDPRYVYSSLGAWVIARPVVL
jgi:hypothetical protein